MSEGEYSFQLFRGLFNFKAFTGGHALFFKIFDNVVFFFSFEHSVTDDSFKRNLNSDVP